MAPKKLTPQREPDSRPQIDPSDLSDEARKRLVRSDAVRKRAAHAFPEGMVPHKYLYRAVPEFDRLRAAARAAARSGARSSSGMRSSSRSMVVRMAPQPEEEGYDTAAFGRSLSHLDFVPANAEDAIIATIMAWSAADAAVLEEQRRQTAEANEALLKQDIAASLADPLVSTSSSAATPLRRRVTAPSRSPARPRVGLGLGCLGLVYFASPVITVDVFWL